MRIGGAMFFTDYSMSPTEVARALEDRGFDSLWVPEHSHIPLTRKSPFPSGGDLPKKYYDVMDPFVMLGAAAAVTKTLLLGTGICLIVQRDPIQTAKQVASIDQISGGRFLFGVGNGWNEDEMANHGTAFASRHKLARDKVAERRVVEAHLLIADHDPGKVIRGRQWSGGRCVEADQHLLRPSLALHRSRRCDTMRPWRQARPATTCDPLRAETTDHDGGR